MDLELRREVWVGVLGTAWSPGIKFRSWAGLPKRVVQRRENRLRWVCGESPLTAPRHPSCLSESSVTCMICLSFLPGCGLLEGGNTSLRHIFPRKIYVGLAQDRSSLTPEGWKNDYSSMLLLLLLSCISRVWFYATHRQQPTRLLHPWDSPGKNTGVGCHFLFQCMKVKSVSRIRLLVTSWTAAYQAPLFMGFSRQEYWSGSPVPSLSSMLRAYYLPGTFLSALHLVINLIFGTT